MNTNILEAIDKEIAHLQQARSILLGATDAPGGVAPLTKGRRGRPKGSKNAVAVAPAKAKRALSAEGRARIAEAQRKRHASKKRLAKKAETEASS
jgi:hypothetical protein